MFGNLVSTLNQNKYFYGISMILFNIGARYIEIDLDEEHIKFLSSTFIRRILIFTMAFIATRDIVASLVITASFIIIVLNLFNKKSDYCIIPKNNLDLNKDGYISPKEIEKAYEILKKAGKI
tara:strand:- start:866 stop:1231 length:366 start_codon:yes stop_codon:yes gene_type:complete